MQGVRLYRLIIFPFLLPGLVLLSSVNAFTQNRYPAGENLLMRRFNAMNGQAFAELELENEQGELVRTSSFRGKTLYVDFWFTTCSPCFKEIPYAKSLHTFFAQDTNIIFLNICIENVDRKDEWKKMVAEKMIGGINLFYARNRPQSINLLRKYNILFPTYILVNADMQLIGYDAPRPSEKGWVHWAIYKAARNVSLAEAYKERNSEACKTFLRTHQADIDCLQPGQ